MGRGSAALLFLECASLESLRCLNVTNCCFHNYPICNLGQIWISIKMVCPVLLCLIQEYLIIDFYKAVLIWQEKHLSEGDKELETSNDVGFE